MFRIRCFVRLSFDDLSTKFFIFFKFLPLLLFYNTLLGQAAPSWETRNSSSDAGAAYRASLAPATHPRLLGGKLATAPWIRTSPGANGPDRRFDHLLQES